MNEGDFKAIDEVVDDIVEEDAEKEAEETTDDTTTHDDIDDDRGVVEEEMDWAVTGPPVEDFTGVMGESVSGNQ